MASISEYVNTLTLGWFAVAAIFGVEIQLEQSSVGNTLLSRIIFPPMLASFSTSKTLKPMSPSVRADSIPAMPAPTIRAS